ncbi:MAG: class I SAM-dependent methyltransferase [Burkholderiaceae bacterium]|nr:class I SAM-dependent methyltransferase [Burkholderiaceae bacterium]
MDLKQATACLENVLSMDPANLDAHNLREQYRLPGCFSDWMGVNTQISTDDDIFRFFANHPSSKNPVRDYLADGWRTMMELHEALGVVDMTLHKCRSFLEFASGHGRFTRHLARIFDQGQLTASDVVSGSVEFLQEAMGVKGFYSQPNASDLKFTEKYDIIFVLSLFSHLPVSVWASWLTKLHGSLAPDGLLIFSTHGERCAVLDCVELPEKGFCFFPSSESLVLAGEDYGTTFAKLDFVKSTVKEALGKQVEMHSIPSHFWGRQDAILVRASQP